MLRLKIISENREIVGNAKDQKISGCMNKKYVILIGLAVILIGSAFLFKLNLTGKTISNPSSELGEEIPILGRGHVSEGIKVAYNSNPPTSGDHWPQPAEWGFYDYDEPIQDEILVHNLEHGGIWISYSDFDKETDSKLKVIAEKYPQAVIVTPRPQNDAKIALASWGRLLKLDKFDEELIISFIKNNVNKAPEPLASLEQPAIRVGVIFPDFTVTEVGGSTISRESVKDKPTIIWFTTTWCVPCQIGAREVAKLDNQLGDDRFNVLVVFVDPRETDSDLINWRDKFANKDWIVAFDNELTNLATRVNLKFLDSKFLIDKNSVIKNIDFKTADENYLNAIKQVVEESV